MRYPSQPFPPSSDTGSDRPILDMEAVACNLPDAHELVIGDQCQVSDNCLGRYPQIVFIHTQLLRSDRVHKLAQSARMASFVPGHVRVTKTRLQSSVFNGRMPVHLEQVWILSFDKLAVGEPQTVPGAAHPLPAKLDLSKSDRRYAQNGTRIERISVTHNITMLGRVRIPPNKIICMCQEGRSASYSSRKLSVAALKALTSSGDLVPSTHWRTKSIVDL